MYVLAMTLTPQERAELAAWLAPPLSESWDGRDGFRRSVEAINGQDGFRMVIG